MCMMLERVLAYQERVLMVEPAHNFQECSLDVHICLLLLEVQRVVGVSLQERDTVDNEGIDSVK